MVVAESATPEPGLQLVSLNGRRVGLEDDEWKQSP